MIQITECLLSTKELVVQMTTAFFAPVPLFRGQLLARLQNSNTGKMYFFQLICVQKLCLHNFKVVVSCGDQFLLTEIQILHLTHRQTLVNVPILKSFLLVKCSVSYGKVWFDFTAGSVGATKNDGSSVMLLSMDAQLTVVT